MVPFYPRPIGLYLRVCFLMICFLLGLPGVALAQNTLTGAVMVGGSPVGNARITLFTPSLQSFYETRTGPDGRYSLGSVPAGSFVSTPS